MSTYPIRLKRIDDPPEQSDGTRVLVDRLWPRGITRAKARIDVWMKAAAPAADLRVWDAHDVTRWRTFRQRYRSQLAQNPDALVLLKKMRRSGQVTLITATEDVNHSSAIILEKMLEKS